MTRQNLHTHTVFDDGNNTPMEMARAALEAGLSSLGFSGHSVLPWQNDWAMTEESESAYITAVAEAKEAFRARLPIYCGLEWDQLSAPPRPEYDYIIGSIHHIGTDAVPPLTVDESPAVSRRILERTFHGDPDAMAEAYFAQYAELAQRDFVDIVGHFDLLTKFSEKDPLLPRGTRTFMDCAVAAMELLIRAGKLFEVNTGAISRGWRTTPYPSAALLKELKARSARVLVTADAHSADAVAYAFVDTEALLRELGFREVWHYGPGGFFPVPLT